MRIQQVKIHSDLRKKDQIYQVSDEVEQELDIYADGKVALHALSHEGLPCWEEEKEMDEDSAKEILDLLNRFLDNPEQKENDSVGQWSLKAIYADGSTKEAKGPMTGEVIVDGINLTEIIREKCPFMSLGVFDQTDAL